MITPSIDDRILNGLNEHLQKTEHDDGKPHHIEVRLPDEKDGKVRHLGICLTIPDMQALRDELLKEALHRREVQAAMTRRKKAGDIPAKEIRLAVIASKELGYDYLTKTVLRELPKESKEYVLDELGRINLYDLSGSGNPEEVLKEIDTKVQTPFLMMLLAIAGEADIREVNTSSGNDVIPIYLPNFFRNVQPSFGKFERDAETRKTHRIHSDIPRNEQRLNQFVRDYISPLSKVGAWFNDTDLYPLVTLDHYNRDTDVVYVRSPYMFRLVEWAKTEGNVAISYIFHADVLQENPTAVELANRISIGLISRGVSHPDKNTYKAQPKAASKTVKEICPDGTTKITTMKYAIEPVETISVAKTDEDGRTKTRTRPVEKPKVFTYDIEFKNLIKGCPQLQKELDDIRKNEKNNKSAAVNRRLSQVFNDAINIILNKSDAPTYYANLTICTAPFDTFKAPTNSTLKSKLVIRHNGKTKE